MSFKSFATFMAIALTVHCARAQSLRLHYTFDDPLEATLQAQNDSSGHGNNGNLRSQVKRRDGRAQPPAASPAADLGLPVVLDSSGFGTPANGTLFGGANRIANTPGGFSSGALDLTGTGSRYASTVTDADKVDALGSYTFTTWLNLQGAPSAADRLLVDSSDGSAGSIQLVFAPPTSGGLLASDFRLYLAVYDRSDPFPDVLYSPDLSADHNWIFLAATFDDANNLGRFYLGGVGTPVVEIASGAINQSLAQNTDPFILGGSGLNFLDLTPPAYLDDVRVYSGAANQDFLEAVRLQNVPEPGTALLLGLAALAFFGWGRVSARR